MTEVPTIRVPTIRVPTSPRPGRRMRPVRRRPNGRAPMRPRPNSTGPKRLLRRSAWSTRCRQPVWKEPRQRSPGHRGGQRACGEHCPSVGACSMLTRAHAAPQRAAVHPRRPVGSGTDRHRRRTLMTPDPPFDMQQLLKQAQQMQQSLMAAQEELSQARIAGTSGGGLVTATVNGKGDLLALKIDPEALGPAGDPDAAETLADLVLAAVRDATGNASALASSTMGPLAEGLGGLGGGGLGGIGGSVPGLGL